MSLRPPVPETGASTNSTTSASITFLIYHLDFGKSREKVRLALDFFMKALAYSFGVFFARSSRIGEKKSRRTEGSSMVQALCSIPMGA